jgi:hypothetical protein
MSVTAIIRRASGEHEPSRSIFRIILRACGLVLLVPASGLAYVGPGAGITLLGALWAVIVAIAFMVGGLVVWPFRALMRRKKKEKNSPQGESEKQP